ncbi:MAG: hypothetical protein Q7S33_01005 [Nanoarchaeota archaeon]|nr:hypothetical protein [Nanoarchaeota archaeon]
MNSMNDILGMVATEAIEGTWGDSGIGDEALPIQQSYESKSLENSQLPLLKYNLELIRDENGNLRWVE